MEFSAQNDVAVTSTIDELHVSGDLAVANVSYRQSVTPKAGGESVNETGSWLIVWGRQPDETWKITMEMWSALPAQ